MINLYRKFSLAISYNERQSHYECEPIHQVNWNCNVCGKSGRYTTNDYTSVFDQIENITCTYPRTPNWIMNNASMPEQPQYTHSIKIEDTAKGIRLSVHVYANSTGEAIEQAFTMYLKAKMTAIDNKISLAPVEKNNK